MEIFNISSWLYHVCLILRITESYARNKMLNIFLFLLFHFFGLICSGTIIYYQPWSDFYFYVIHMRFRPGLDQDYISKTFFPKLTLKTTKIFPFPHYYYVLLMNFLFVYSMFCCLQTARKSKWAVGLAVYAWRRKIWPRAKN